MNAFALEPKQCADGLGIEQADSEGRASNDATNNDGNSDADSRSEVGEEKVISDAGGQTGAHSDG